MIPTIQKKSQIDTKMTPKCSQMVSKMYPKCTPGTHFAHKVSRSPFSLDFRMPLGCHWIPIGLPLGGFGETLGTTWPHILMKNLSKSTSWNRLHFSSTFSSFVWQNMRGSTLSWILYLSIGSHIATFLKYIYIYIYIYIYQLILTPKTSQNDFKMTPLGTILAPKCSNMLSKMGTTSRWKNAI